MQYGMAFMPKNGNKKVEIGFMLLKDDLLICTIKIMVLRKAAEKNKTGKQYSNKS